ncbi:MAG: glycosyltransferase family 4 protein [Tatlockia sp.]|nr:glycosyltransferase family 4 protein [Tatlockia sp.]
MKIALCSSFVPFVYGGARNIVEWLETMLLEAGHQVERIYLPQADTADLLVQQKMAYRWIDLDAADRIICFRPPAHLIPHPHKILWFIHHIRVFYDLWDSPYRGCPDDSKHRGIRDALHATDTAALKEANKIFTNSAIVSSRLQTFNKIDSEVLYPPIFRPERFYCKDYSDEIVYICRLEHHKRQHLLVEAMQYTKTPVRLRLCGASSNPDYTKELTDIIANQSLEAKVILDDRWISEEEKIEILAGCLAAAYLPLDEDSYGYPSIEASHALKAILTTSDSGGVLELVEEGINGYIAEPLPQALAETMDKFYIDRAKTKLMGANARERLNELNISWSHVLERLLA